MSLEKLMVRARICAPENLRGCGSLDLGRSQLGASLEEACASTRAISCCLLQV